MQWNVALVVFLTAVVKASQRADLARETLVAANNEFGIDLYQALKNESGNLVVSPLSVSALMSLVYYGARGRTALQLKRTLHLQHDPADAAEAFSDVLSSLLESEAMTVLLANKLYVREGMNVKEDFRQVAENNFAADVQEISFANRQRAALAINQWVDEVTEGKIKTVLAQDRISSGLRSILVSANYFEGSWREQFNENDTVTMPFHTSTGQVNASMMVKTSSFWFRRVHAINATILQIPFQDTFFSMLVVLPNTVDGMNEVERNIRGFQLTNHTDEMKEDTIKVYLPKFSFPRRLNLQPVLTQMGIIDVFQHTANLTEIAVKKIFVNKLFQKTFIDINERGAGDAQREDTNVTQSPGTHAREFNVNRPFLYAIVANETILFIGKIIDPTI